MLGITLQEANAPAPAPALSPAPAPALSPAPAPAVAGENLVAGADLPRTGAANVPFLMALALSLLAAGLTLRILRSADPFRLLPRLSRRPVGRERRTNERAPAQAGALSVVGTAAAGS